MLASDSSIGCAMTNTANSLQFPDRIGLGTWQMGGSSTRRAHEIAAVRHALEVGYRVIDTAEMYADGGAERIIGAALDGVGAARRAELFIVSKVMPDNASRRGTVRACEASIHRMGCDYLDLYLLHWPGKHPYSATLEGMAELHRRGLVRHVGVSNFDVEQLQGWLQAEAAAGANTRTQCNQLYYCAEARGIEYQQLPWQREHGVQTMAYSPLGRGALAHHATLERIAQARGATAAQVALAWCLRVPEVMAIPKSSDPQRIEQNFAAASLQLDAAELQQIEQSFPAPRRRQPLQTV
jgi:diketogulonate reductase-like aldo/keto reductase